MRVIILAVATLLSRPAAAYEARLSSSSVLWLEGDSTLHPYSSTATVLEATLTLPDEPMAALARRAPARLELRVPVKELRSAHAGLDKNLRAALRAEEHPFIGFSLSTYTASGGRVSAQGTLTVAGSTRAATIEAAYAVDGAGGLMLRGEKALLMTEFGVHPPTLMLGAVKTADRVVVKFRLALEKAPDGADRGERR